ncbi:hypothetical protein DOTSEDRAFT_39016 [Dothistroma septosporum NZE10]|uniref:Uncharacterized protein n=1 Tax=Dothistroma septosporum (strain NZE10 / CBS 128990) TaxID=675120 RepID=M2YIR9_DOTSN|nr:hypothetical protein DOTSEDRAFT_39016 [Dothistroma septosporum NZE10]
MPSTMTVLKAAASLAFPVAHAQNVFANYVGYSKECASCYSTKLPSAYSPFYVQGDNPLTTVCAAGNDQVFRPCDRLCIDKDGHSFRQNKCAGSVQARQAEPINVFAGMEGYTEDCTSCYSGKLSSAFSPAYTAGDNPLVAVCVSGNNEIFSPCDSKCIDKFGHSFRENKCAGSVEASSNAKRDTSCDICWKSASAENGCLTPFVVVGNEYPLAQCLCQPDKINAFYQKCDASCTTGGMSPSDACNMVGLGKRHDFTPSILTTTTTVTASSKTTPCNLTSSAVVVPVTTTGMPCPFGYKSCYTTAEGGLCILPQMPCPGAANPLGVWQEMCLSAFTALRANSLPPGPSSAPVFSTNSTVPVVSGSGSVGTSSINTNGTAPTETAPISNGALILSSFGLTAFGVVATLLFALA